MDSLKGQLLVSNGDLYDPNFRHTVVLIGEHNEEGALGVVLNRALDITVAQVIPELAELVEPGEPLYQGGPDQVESPDLIAEFNTPGGGDLPVFGHIGFLTGDVSPDVKSEIRRARIYAGYAGWDPGQLEAEMDQDAWIVDPARPEDVFTTEPELLWSRVLRRKGPEFDQLARVPFDPRMN